ncbi:MAG: 30S ribosomal protein S4e [Candidatus Hadarchaeota archaeon]
MAKKGGRRKLKRYAAPRAVKLSRKATKWTTKASAGPHPIDRAIPLRLVVREYLSIARNAREADNIVSRGNVLVDGVARRDPKFPVGFMDVVKVQATGESHRVLLDHRGRLVLNKEAGEDAVKLCKVVGKRIVKGGKIQLASHDGKTMVGDFKEFKVGDVAQVKLPDAGVAGRLPMEVGMLALVTGGENTGKVGRIEEIKLIAGTQPNIIILKSGQDSFQAPEHYIFVVGKEKPVIQLGGGLA